MFFEDEKDTINNPPANGIGWDDVLSDNDDDLISDASFEDDDVLDKISVDDDFDDAINLNDDVSDDDDIELEKILKDETPPKQKAFDAFGAVAAEKKDQDDTEGDYDIDQQLAGVIDENGVVHKVDSEPGIILRERKVHTMDAVKKQFKVSPKILLLLIVFILFSIYYILTQYGSENGITGNLFPFSGKSEVEVENVNPDQNKEDIPVLNEDDIDTPDAKAMLGVEKKQTVEVSQTGRINPFLPDKKYQTTEISYDSSGILKPPSEYGESDEATDKMLSIAVSGIMYDSQKPSAIISYDGNDYFVQKGDKLNDYRVIDISKDYVAIALGKNIYKARVGEEFKITSKFYGSAQYTGGGRQYYSVDMNKDSDSGYVSDSDVEIKSK